MKCLSELQHEMILKEKAGIKGFVWAGHLTSCDSCQTRHKEIKENLNFYNGLEKTLGRDS